MELCASNSAVTGPASHPGVTTASPLSDPVTMASTAPDVERSGVPGGFAAALRSVVSTSISVPAGVATRTFRLSSEPSEICGVWPVPPGDVTATAEDVTDGDHTGTGKLDQDRRCVGHRARSSEDGAVRADHDSECPESRRGAGRRTVDHRDRVAKTFDGGVHRGAEVRRR